MACFRWASRCLESHAAAKVIRAARAEVDPATSTPSFDAELPRLSVVHLVRHPWAVVRSRARLKEFATAGEWNGDGSARGIVGAVCDAMAAKLVPPAAHHAARTLLLRYEDLMEEPHARLAALYEWLGFRRDVPQSVLSRLRQCGLRVRQGRRGAPAQLGADALPSDLADQSHRAWGAVARAIGALRQWDGCSKSGRADTAPEVLDAMRRGGANCTAAMERYNYSRTLVS
jgi:hypothetical protein